MWKVHDSKEIQKILPLMTEEVLEINKIYSVAGGLKNR